MLFVYLLTDRPTDRPRAQASVAPGEAPFPSRPFFSSLLPFPLFLPLIFSSFVSASLHFSYLSFLPVPSAAAMRPQNPDRGLLEQFGTLSSSSPPSNDRRIRGWSLPALDRPNDLLTYVAGASDFDLQRPGSDRLPRRRPITCYDKHISSSMDLRRSVQSSQSRSEPSDDDSDASSVTTGSSTKHFRSLSFDGHQNTSGSPGSQFVHYGYLVTRAQFTAKILYNT